MLTRQGGRWYWKCQQQRCRLVLKSRWASSNVVGIICPLVVIGLTELPNSGWAKAHPAHPLAASLNSMQIFPYDSRGIASQMSTRGRSKKVKKCT